MKRSCTPCLSPTAAIQMNAAMGSTEAPSGTKDRLCVRSRGLCIDGRALKRSNQRARASDRVDGVSRFGVHCAAL